MGIRGRGRNVSGATRPKQLNWWDCGLELFLHITEVDLKELPEVIEWPEVELNVVVEMKPPTCYGCD